MSRRSFRLRDIEATPSHSTSNHVRRRPVRTIRRIGDAFSTTRDQPAVPSIVRHEQTSIFADPTTNIVSLSTESHYVSVQRGKRLRVGEDAQPHEDICDDDADDTGDDGEGDDDGDQARDQVRDPKRTARPRIDSSIDSPETSGTVYCHQIVVAGSNISAIHVFSCMY